MANSRTPGSMGFSPLWIDDGTTCRWPSYPAGPVGFSLVPEPSRPPLSFVADGRIDLDDTLGYAWLSVLAANARQLPNEDACYYAICRSDLRNQDSGSTFADELANTLTAPTNIPGNVVGAASTAWSVATAGKVLTAAEADTLRASMREGLKVGLDLTNGGRVEIYDANAFLRRAARGAMRAAYPPKLRLRLKGVTGTNVSSKIPVRSGLPRVDLGEDAIRTLSRSVSQSDWERGLTRGLPLRRVVAGNAVGLVLAVGPTAIADFRNAQVNGNTDWHRFAVSETRNQPGNIAGFAISVLAVAGLGMVITMTAPVAIGVAVVAGVLGQTAFNSSGASDFLAERVDQLLP